MKIGSLDIEQGILLAPMEDVSDSPFRRICRHFGADIVYTEFISSDGLVRNAPRSFQKLKIQPEEHPIAVQIFGGDIPTMVEAARVAMQSNPDFLDINCGCWVKNVVARNAGAALLKDPPRMVAMARALVEAVPLPVTVKTRLGWDRTSIVICDVARMLEDVGIAALAIHCRTRDMGHSGSADWSWVARVKDVVSIPVILNGDVKSAQDVQRAFRETGCDAVMIGRAAIGNPFIFRQARALLRTGQPEPLPSADERIAVCLEHLCLLIEHCGDERRATIEFRKFYAGYLKALPHAANVRRELMAFESYLPVEERLLRYAEELQTQYGSLPLEEIETMDETYAC
ncbi:MAG: tRNA dihydrouridine synthase DusB [Chlorobi bacterium]|nr:tRNA dihydrouridine synthase DusB [Chlorobiota bacterium]